MSGSLSRQLSRSLRANHSGYTLVEVLVAVIVLSIALLAVLSAISVSSDTQTRAANMAMAHDIAVTHMEDCRSMTEAAILGALPNYSSPDLPPGNSVTVTASRYPNPGSTHMFQATVTITWPEGRGSRSVTYGTLLFKST